MVLLVVGYLPRYGLVWVFDAWETSFQVSLEKAEGQIWSLSKIFSYPEATETDVLLSFTVFYTSYCAREGGSLLQCATAK
jgi:hypothetical protein